MEVNRLETKQTRAQLKLRHNPHKGCWEVYTKAIGTNLFKWWAISDVTLAWYRKNFPEIKEVEYEPNT